jgi:DNA-binding NarL/FixJ family response regulator
MESNTIPQYPLLVISVGTVKSHINHILAKLGAQNRTEAAGRAREMDLL